MVGHGARADGVERQVAPVQRHLRYHALAITVAPILALVVVVLAHAIVLDVSRVEADVDTRLPRLVHILGASFPDDGAGWGHGLALGLAAAAFPLAVPLVWPVAWAFAWFEWRAHRGRTALFVLAVQTVAWLAYASAVANEVLRGWVLALSVDLSEWKIRYADRTPVDIDVWALIAILFPALLVSLVHLWLTIAVARALGRPRPDAERPRPQFVVPSP